MAVPDDYLKRTTVRPWHQHAASSEKIAPAPINALALQPAATPRADASLGAAFRARHIPTLHAHSAGRGARGRGRGALGHGARGRGRGALGHGALGHGALGHGALGHGALGHGPRGAGREPRPGAAANRGARGRGARGEGLTSHVCGADCVRFVRVFRHQIRDRSAQPSPARSRLQGNRGFADGNGCGNNPNRPRSASMPLAPGAPSCAPRQGLTPWRAREGEFSAGSAGRRTPRRPPATRSWRPRRPPGPG